MPLQKRVITHPLLPKEAFSSMAYCISFQHFAACRTTCDAGRTVQGLRCLLLGAVNATIVLRQLS